MKFGLIAVDTHKGYQNLALLKVARYWKEAGHEVEWYSPFEYYDAVYMSKVFSFTNDYGYVINNADQIFKGGTGFGTPYNKLSDEIDCMQPDYSLAVGWPVKQAFGFLTRGCIRKCPWCVVPKAEGEIRPYMDIEEIAIEGRNHIVLMDNNIIAAGDYGLGQIEKIIKLKLTIDFNQAMDARLVTDDIAAMLAKCKWIDNVIRFGCDTAGQISHCETAIKRLWKHGYTGSVNLYTMLHGDIYECYDRCSRWRSPEWKGRVMINPQPMLDLTSRVQHIPAWQKAMARWGVRKMIYFSTDFMDYEAVKGTYGRDYFKPYEDEQKEKS